MSRRKPEPVDPATLPPPAVIARQIADDLAKAQRAFAAVARSLEQPAPEPSGTHQASLFDPAP
ncbi:hypothetical protein [Streptomyces sp. NPDC058254]|uniref:hypothetical protein n=1 Tax=Streptomyces sp. NPDC058254 TaxID=3346406 RepID=UPI0036EDA60D